MKDISKSKKRRHPHQKLTVAETRRNTIYRVTILGSVVNLLLSVGKLLAGILGRSGAMIADAVHSLSDFATDIVVIGFVSVSAKPRDASHDFGHGKFETLASIIIGFALSAVGVGILVNSVGLIRDYFGGAVIQSPGLIALLAAPVSIAVKEGLFQYTLAEGKKINSPAVQANAWHHRSDALSSVGTLFGIGGAYFLGESWRILDPIAAIVVSILILKAAFDLVIPGINELVEKSLPEETKKKIIEVVMEDHEIQDPHNLKTRKIGAAIAVELHIRLQRNMTVAASHAVTVGIEERLKKTFGPMTQVIVHVEPVRDEESSI